MSRKRSGSPAPSPRPDRRWGVNLPEVPLGGVGAAIGVALIGLTFGYVVAARLVFPAPAPPGDLVEVPELLGLALDDGLEAVTRAGFTVGAIDSIAHPSVAAGAILGQIPVPEQLALAGSPVRVAVSSGPETGEVPDLRRLPHQRAVSLLELAGFTAQIDSADSPLPAGAVVSVEPAAGTRLPLPAELRVALSRGPRLVQMPDILGMPRAQAEALLDSLGLVRGETRTRWSFGLDQGRVIEQEPPAGRMVEPGSQVALVVARSSGGGGRP